MNSIARLFKNIWLLISGQAGDKADEISRQGVVIQENYRRAINVQTDRIKEGKDGCAGIVALLEERKENIEQLRKQVDELGKQARGAKALSIKRKGQLASEGKTREQILDDTALVKYMAAYKDFSSTLNAKGENLEQMVKELEEKDRDYERHAHQIRTATRELQRLKEEAKESKADVQFAKIDQTMADAASGLATDKGAEALQQARDATRHVKAAARVAKDTRDDTGLEDAEYAALADAAEADEELMSELFGDDPDLAPPKKQVVDEKLPE